MTTIDTQWPVGYDDGKIPDAAEQRLHNLDGTPTVEPPAPPGTLDIPDIAEVIDSHTRKIVALDHKVGIDGETGTGSLEDRVTTIETDTATTVRSINGQAGPDVALGHTDVGADIAGAADTAITAHLGQPDPHPQYQLEIGKDVVGGYAGIDPSTGKILPGLIPVVNITRAFPVANEAEMLALGNHVPPAVPGNLAIRADLPGTFLLSGDDPSILGNWIELPNPAGGVVSVNDATGAVVIPEDGSAAVPSLRTLGTAGTQAAPGNDARLSDARTPIVHHASHGSGGSDPIVIDGSQISGAGTIAESLISAAITRDTEMTTAIGVEIAARDSAITTAVAAEVTSRNSAITTAVNNLQTALVNGAPGTLDSFLEAYNQFLADESVAAALATTVGGKLDRSLYDAQTVLTAIADNTPVALTVAEQTIVGRVTGGNVAALSPAQVKTILAIASTDVSGLGTSATKNTDTDGTLAANSDAVIATQKAVRTAIATETGRASGVEAGLTTSIGAVQSSASYMLLQLYR